MAVYLNTTVEEVRKIKSEPHTDCLESKAEAAPELKENPNAWYCRNRADGLQYSIEFDGQRYCTLQGSCYCQVQNGRKAKKCTYRPK